MFKISISTNVTSLDAKRILNVLPNWIKIFGDNIKEILIVYDKIPIEGRIKELHHTLTKNKTIEFYFDEIIKIDNRIRIIELDYAKVAGILRKWFKDDEKPIRCQAGTPIFAFIFAIEEALSDLILKVDCDMIFYDNGFVQAIFNYCSSNKYELLEIAKLGSNLHSDFSTRAFFINRNLFYTKLPIVAYKLDILRQIHRLINNRPPYIALEQMIQKEIEKNRISRLVLPPELGYTMHISTREEMNLSDMNKIIKLFGNGIIPVKQKINSENFDLRFWEEIINKNKF